MEILSKRLQVQTTGRTGIDRSISFVIGEAPADERAKLRGVVFDADSKLDALDTYRELRKLAQEAVARGEINKFLDTLDRRTPAAPDNSPTFQAFSVEWEKTCVVGGGLRESQVESDQSILKLHLRPFFGKLRLREIDPRLIDRYKAGKRVQKHQYGTGYSGKTINNHLGVLHRLFEKAIEYGLVDRNPVTKKAWLKRESTPEDAQNWWTPAEERRAVATLERWRTTDPLARMAILTQLVTGIRFSELRALEKADLDLQASGIWVRRSQARKTVGTPKNKRARFQPIPSELAGELKEWMLRVEGQRLFWS